MGFERRGGAKHLFGKNARQNKRTKELFIRMAVEGIRAFH
jgi:hypothetical protein